MARLLLALCGFLLGGSSFSQNINEPILLTNHKITAEGINLEYEAGEVVNGRIYRIMQYNKPVMHIGAEEKGIRVLEYLPKRAFVISIDVNEMKTAKEKILSMANSVIAFQPEWKLSKRLHNQNIPAWAWLGNGEFKLWVRYYSDLDHQWVMEQLYAKGYSILDEKATEDLIALAVNPDEVGTLSQFPFLVYLQEMEDPGTPENYTARTSHRVNTLQTGPQNLTGYTGNGVVVGHGDDGALGYHIDYKGRLIQNSPPSDGDHGDHVAGTIFGAGNLDPQGQGMAPGAHIYYQDYPDNLNGVDQNFLFQNVRITASSYSNGCNEGYTNFTRRMDQDAVQHPELLHIFSAGNDGNSDCDYGAGSGWGNVTGGHKIAKNVIAVANLNHTDGISGSSSRGPAEDGRIKPDLGAVGSNVYSTTDLPVPNSYTNKSGTSMACPGVAGVAATLYEAYRLNNAGQDPHGGLLKAIMMNTAKDLGNPGPDFIHGYGRVNARKAAEAIENATYFSGTVISANGPQSFQLTPPSGNIAEVKIMLYWPDAPASTNASRDLVNDLDLDVSQNGNNYDPWVLNPTPVPSLLNSNAVRARDSLNNVEQVTIANPGSGTIDIQVSPTNVPSGSQDFFVVYEFVMDDVVLTYPKGGETVVPGDLEYIRWDAPLNSSNFATRFSSDSGSTWSSINNNVPSFNLFGPWLVPNIATSGAMVRLIRGQDTSTSGVFTILGEPENLSVVSNCPDSLILTWDSVANTDGYVIYQLGNEYMDSIDFTTDTSYRFMQANPTVEKWFSVAATVDGSAGRRAIAVTNSGRVYNCPLSEDVVAVSLISPFGGVSKSCIYDPPVPVKVKLRNEGSSDVFNFNLHYSFNGGAVQNEMFTDTLSPGSETVYTFSSTLPALASNIFHNLKLWVDYSSDLNRYNDTIQESIYVYNSGLKTAPYFNDFEAFALCSTNDDCGAINCSLNDGWINLPNGAMDDIDFRTNSGSTPSGSTGPFQDHNPGTTTGKYLYLEASGGCEDNEAILLSPCIYLDSSIMENPVVEFRYHMNGGDMGTLNVDVMTEDGLIENIVPQVSGNRFTPWWEVRFSLAEYVGQNVVVRFRGRTGDGHRSDLALDDFSVTGGQPLPVADFVSVSDSNICAPDTVMFEDRSTGTVSTYEWDFGAGATPATANTAGPHEVVYTTGGVRNVSLKVGNSGGYDQKNINLDVGREPLAGYSYNVAQNTVTFTDGSLHNPTSWLWEFGDGITSTAASPVYQYMSVGTYGVTLTVSNDCGTHSFTDSISIDSIANVGLDEMSTGNISLFPNPTAGKLSLQISWETEVYTIKLMDVNGKLLKVVDTSAVKDGRINIDLSGFADGVYLISINTNKGSQHHQVIRES